MNTFPRRYLAASVALLLLPITSQADPAIRTKANNTNNLDLGSSWVGGTTPSAIEIGLWDATILGANASALGSNRVWLGMRITNPGGAVTINPGNTLTLGYSGIDMSTATQNLTISSGLTLRTGHGQIWNINTGTTLFLNTGAFARAPGAVLNIRGAGTVTTSNIANDANDLVGTWATIGATTGTQYATVSGGNIVGLAGTNTATAANVTDTTGAVNYNMAAVGALGTGANFSTLRYTGAGGSITGNFSANGILNAGTGTLAMSGNITIGSSRELVVTTPDATRSINLTGAIGNHSTGASGFTKAGDGTVTLSGANTYSGLTSVSRGFLAVSHNSALGDSLSGTRITGSGRLTFNGGVTTSEALFIDMDMINDATIPAGTTPLTMSGNNTLAGHFRAGTQIRTSGGTVTTLTGGISSTAVSTGTFVLGFSEFHITTTPMSIGNGDFYRDSGNLAVIGVAGNTWGSTSACAGTIRTDVEDALPATATIQFGTTYTSGTFTLNLNGNDQTTSQISHDSFVVAGKDRVITSTGGPATLTLNQSTTTNFNGRFQGEVSLVKTGTGRINLSGPSTTTGTFTVNGGTLTISDLGAGGSNVFVFLTSTGVWDGGLFEYEGTAIEDGDVLLVAGNEFALDYDYNGNSVALVVPETSSLPTLLGGFGMLLGIGRPRRRPVAK